MMRRRIPREKRTHGSVTISVISGHKNFFRRLPYPRPDFGKGIWAHPTERRFNMLWKAFPLIAAAVLVTAARAEQNDFVFSSIDVPGADRTTLQGINDAGEISGIFLDSRGEHGFTLRAAVCGRHRSWRRDLIVVDYPGAA